MEANNSIVLVVWVVVLFAFMYFFMIRPQQKEQNEKTIGDTILTTSGFYGVIIAIQDDTVIVEFGSDKHCRIPMTKASIAQVEKPEDAVKATEEKTK